jgi:hypothetical protein
MRVSDDNKTIFNNNNNNNNHRSRTTVNNAFLLEQRARSPENDEDVNKHERVIITIYVGRDDVQNVRRGHAAVAAPNTTLSCQTLTYVRTSTGVSSSSLPYGYKVNVYIHVCVYVLIFYCAEVVRGRDEVTTSKQKDSRLWHRWFRVLVRVSAYDDGWMCTAERGKRHTSAAEVPLRIILSRGRVKSSFFFSFLCSREYTYV